MRTAIWKNRKIDVCDSIGKRTVGSSRGSAALFASFYAIQAATFLEPTHWNQNQDSKSGTGTKTVFRAVKLNWN